MTVAENEDNAAISQGLPKIADKTPESRKRRRRVPLEVPEAAWTCQSLDFELLVSRTVRQ